MTMFADVFACDSLSLSCFPDAIMNHIYWLSDSLVYQIVTVHCSVPYLSTKYISDKILESALAMLKGTHGAIVPFFDVPCTGMK